MKRRVTASVPGRRPKRMVVPATQQDLLDESFDAYEQDLDGFLEKISTGRIPRPLPSSTVLAAAAAAAAQHVVEGTTISTRRGLAMPLLEHLQFQQDNPLEQTAQGETTTTSENVEQVDHGGSSTLTKGQHARYLQLISTQSLTTATRKEFLRLRKRVQQEQQVYKQAMEAFWQRHVQRFKIGLESEAAKYCAAYAKQYQVQYQQHQYPHCFGPCRQVISLQPHAQDSSSFPNVLDSISSHVVHVSSLHESPTTRSTDWQPPERVPVFAESKMPPLLLLADDNKAMELAKQHNASIVTTHETLQSLLQLSGDSSGGDGSRNDSNDTF